MKNTHTKVVIFFELATKTWHKKHNFKIFLEKKYKNMFSNDR